MLFLAPIATTLVKVVAAASATEMFTAGAVAASVVKATEKKRERKAGK